MDALYLKPTFGAVKRIEAFDVEGIGHHPAGLSVKTFINQMGPYVDGTFFIKRGDPIHKRFLEHRERFESEPVKSHLFKESFSIQDEIPRITIPIYVRGDVNKKFAFDADYVVRGIRTVEYYNGKQIFKKLSASVKGLWLEIKSQVASKDLIDEDFNYPSLFIDVDITLQGNGLDLLSSKFLGPNPHEYFFRQYVKRQFGIPGAIARVYWDERVTIDRYMEQDWNWEGSIKENRRVVFPLKPFYSMHGLPGSRDNPYRISTVHQFLSIKEKTASHYILDNSIFLDEVPLNLEHGWAPFPFYGELDLNGHIIGGITSRLRQGVVGLFSINKGVIKNGEIWGTLSGFGAVGTVAAMNFGKIQGIRCSGLLEGAGITGGICGVNFGTVYECLYDGAILPITPHESIGSIVGIAMKGSYQKSIKSSNEIYELIGTIEEGANL